MDLEPLTEKCLGRKIVGFGTLNEGHLLIVLEGGSSIEIETSDCADDLLVSVLKTEGNNHVR